MRHPDTSNGLQSRRRLLAMAAAAQVGMLLPWRHAGAVADVRPTGSSDIGFGPAADPAAFAADAADRAVGLLTSGASPRRSADVAIDAPDLFEDGAVVPMTLRGTVPNVRRLAVLVDKNPTPLVAMFRFGTLVAPEFGIRLKMAETSDVRLLGWSAGTATVAEARRRVAVVEGGCGDEPIADELTSARLPGPMRIRAEQRRGQGAGVVVRVLMRHPMETGLRKDGAGRIVAAWYITHVRATLDGALAFEADWGNAVAANPYLQFTLPGAGPGARVALEWADNRGATRRDETTVA